MNWDLVAALGEIVGAIAVVVSLLYLAAQIKQSNRQSASDTAAVVAAHEIVQHPVLQKKRTHRFRIRGSHCGQVLPGDLDFLQDGSPR